ncbi:MAG: antibiotic biosynthesis monooxygenase [Coriobacteriia bacterium]|nr:antibiotic biosynthesis monooxygenase [Coriobacteriia bacterium]
MIKVTATLVIPTETKDDAMVVIEELVATTVLEDGCINYNFCQETVGVDAYAILETWESKEALDAHMKTEHFTRLVPQLSALAKGDIVLSVYEVLL